MIRMCRKFFWKVTAKKRYQNDTRTIPQYASWEPWAGGRPPTHPPEQNIDTLSLGATCSHSIFHGWKQWLEKRKRRTKQSNKYSTSPWHCASQNAHITGSFVGLDTVPVICCAVLLKRYKFYFYWKGPSAHTRTHEQRVSFLQCSPEKGPFSSSTFGCKDVTCGEWGASVEVGPSSYALSLCKSLEEKLEKRQGTWL